MGKKVRKKGRTPVKEKKVVKQLSTKTTVEESNQSVEAVANGVSVDKEKRRCAHLNREVDLSKLSEKINGEEAVRCEDCRETAGSRRGNKGKGKHGKKKVSDAKSESKAIWICLECGHYACGGIGFPTTPQSHAVRHARQTRHPLAVQFENPGLRWCFPCNMLIPNEKTEENGAHKDVFTDAVKLIKGRTSKGASADVEDSWLEARRATSDIKSEGTSLGGLDGKGGYAVRGLANLGNTCFFNSVTQNLLSITRLRDYFLKLDESIGPLTISLKKLYTETNPEAGLKGTISPRSFFGTLCSKAPQFRGYQQHDSHELLRCLLDGLCTEELGARKKSNVFREGEKTPKLGPTFVDAVFCGEISSTVRCVECGHSSTVYEPFLDLSLPVPTKKPPSKRAQPPPRAKKTKVPPKKGGKTRQRANKNSATLPLQDVPDVSETSKPSHQVQPSFHASEGKIATSGDSATIACTGSTNSSSEKDLVSQNSSAVQSDKQQAVGTSTQQSTPNPDDSASGWLDYLDPATGSDEHCWTSQDDHISVSQNFPAIQSDNEEVVEKSIKHPMALCDGSSWMEYLDPTATTEEHNLVSQDNQNTVVKDSGNNDLIQKDGPMESGCVYGSHTHSLSEELNQEPYSSVDPWEDERPLLVNSSEVLLLPYKEEASSTGDVMTGEVEGPSSVVGYGQDDVGFDGFGDLFNEPEVVGPSTSSLSNGNFQDADVAESSFMAGNSTESDPDEVDNADAPVSVESCLAHFTKPELLCNDNAWHCENCAKILQQQQLAAKKRARNGSKTLMNGSENGAQNDTENIDNDLSLQMERKNSCNETVKCNNSVNCNDKSLVSDNGVVDHPNENCDDVLSGQDGEAGSVDSQEREVVMTDVEGATSSSSCYETCHEASLSDQANDSASLGECSSSINDTSEVKSIDSKLSCDCLPDEDKDDQLKAVNVKVKRDATKRVLVNKVPPILTIHLKRFSQDARGRLNKLNGHVIFKEIIDLRPYIDSRALGSEKYEYHLVGVVEHMGTMRGGHYVAYVRGGKRVGKSENEFGASVWYHVNDAYVREVSLEEVLRCEAYILFYEKI